MKKVKKILKQEYTAEFKDQAVKHAQGVGIVVAARELGLVEQTLRNWVKASAAGVSEFLCVRRFAELAVG